MRKVKALIVFIFLCKISGLAQIGWNYFTLGPSIGVDYQFNKYFYSGELKFEHLKQKKGFDIYGKYFYKAASIKIGYSNDDIVSYSAMVSGSLLRKRLYEVFAEIRYKDRPIPPEKANFLYVPGLRLYPVWVFSPIGYSGKGFNAYFLRPGVGVEMNYGHLATWKADFRLSINYFYNIPVSGQLPPGYSNSILCVQLGVGFKIDRNEEEKSK